MVVGVFFPATAGPAVRELLSELKAQMAAVMSMLEQAARDIVSMADGRVLDMWCSSSGKTRVILPINGAGTSLAKQEFKVLVVQF